MLRAVLPPLITAFALFAAMVRVAVRRPVRRPRLRAGWTARPIRELAEIVTAGYAVFLAIVLVFHVWLARETDALANAAWGGAVLSAVAALLGTVPVRRRR